MKKTDISLIKKFVNGEDLGEYSMEQLENNTDFMIDVISYTGDYKMYSSCSEEVKKDYKLVKYLVLKFKDKEDFITKVADNYLYNADTDLERIELCIIMENILPEDLSGKYRSISKAVYFTRRVEIEALEIKDPKIETMIGMGFWLIFDQYNGSDVILDYYAKCLLDEIIRDNNIDFEKMLHNQFKSADKITEIGINNYIVNFIGYYDSMLSSYISTHLEIVNPIASRIKQIQDNWNNYSLKDEAKRYNNMLSMVHDYMNMTDSNILESELLYYIAKELGIFEKLKQYDGTTYLIDNDFDIDSELDEEVIEDIVKFEIDRSFKEKSIYLKVKKIIMNQLFSDKPLDLYSLIDEDKRQTIAISKNKIIKINPNGGK